MQTLHINLKSIARDYVELRYFFSNPNQYQQRSLDFKQIQDLIRIAEQNYYTVLPEDFAKTGRQLYEWLDGSGRWLEQALNQHRGEGIVLAIAAAEKLAHLPWEVLHDGNSFLVERLPGVVPVRWVSSDTVNKLSIEAEPENRALQVLFMATSPLGAEPELDFEAEEGRILEATVRKPLTLTVEESGCLSELGNLVDDYGSGYFDVLHLTGHATLALWQTSLLYGNRNWRTLPCQRYRYCHRTAIPTPQTNFPIGLSDWTSGEFGDCAFNGRGVAQIGSKSCFGLGSEGFRL